MRILLIEPDPILAKLYIRALHKENFEVEWVQKAEKAIIAADTKKPDLVVLELDLPSHNGVEFLSEFKSYSDWEKIPVIINSFDSSTLLKYKTNTAELLNIKAVHYKPQTTISDLVISIKKFLPNYAQAS